MQSTGAVVRCGGAVQLTGALRWSVAIDWCGGALRWSGAVDWCVAVERCS